MANGNAYKHFVTSNAESDENKEYNIVGALFVIAIVVLIILM